MITSILPVRGNDAHGSGAWGASRGSRTHKGIDFAAFPLTRICSPIDGECTKLGYPYGDDLSFQYVEVTDERGRQHRFFYLEPLVKVGDTIKTGQPLGTVQDLERRYHGITPHCHYEIKRNGEYLNPAFESI